MASNHGAYEAAKFKILSENQVAFLPEKYMGVLPEINASRIAVESLASMIWGSLLESITKRILR